MSVKLIDLREFGRVLSTREGGRKAADHVQEVLEESDGVVLSFVGVEVASPSFLDEILLRLRAALTGESSRVVVVTGLNGDVSESLELVLRHRKLTLAHLRKDKVELIGGSQQLAETLSAANELGGPFKATELAERLKVKLPNLHQRLKSLGETGVVARTVDSTAKKGRRFDYRTFDASKAKSLVPS
jgi:DNA-binding transcriptional ArsR family regulator